MKLKHFLHQYVVALLFGGIAAITGESSFANSSQYEGREEVYVIQGKIGNLTIEGLVEQEDLEQLTRMVGRIPNIVELLASEHKKYIIISSGRDVLDDGYLREEFKLGATGELYNSLSSKKYKPGICTLERRRGSDGSIYLWMIIEVLNNAGEAANKCFLMTVGVHVGLDLFDITDLSAKQIFRKIYYLGEEYSERN